MNNRHMKRLNITNHQGNAYQNHNELSITLVTRMTIIKQTSSNS